MADILPFLLLGVMAAISWCAGRHVRLDPLPMRWDFRGRPTRYASRLVALWFPVLLAVALVMFTSAVSDDTAPVWLVPFTALVSLAIQIFYFTLLYRWQSRLK